MPIYRKANKVNLVVGIALILAGILAMIFPANPASGVILGLLFSSFGGYEVGKYEERRHASRETNLSASHRS